MFAYFHSILYHESCHVLTQSKRAVPTEYIEILSDGDDPATDELIRMADQSAIRQCIAGLTGNYRLVLKMRYYDGADDDTISAVLGLQPGHVRMILTRARGKLRRLYLEEMQGKAPAEEAPKAKPKAAKP